MTACTHPIKDKDEFSIHGFKVKCFHTPCHTRGHILYYITSEEEIKESEMSTSHQEKYEIVKNIKRSVFTGDTVFVGGCGKFFEGKPEGMLYAMDTLGTLPDDT